MELCVNCRSCVAEDDNAFSGNYLCTNRRSERRYVFPDDEVCSLFKEVIED